jgi:hypothetical protein
MPLSVPVCADSGDDASDSVARRCLSNRRPDLQRGHRKPRGRYRVNPSAGVDLGRLLSASAMSPHQPPARRHCFMPVQDPKRKPASARRRRDPCSWMR